MKNQILTFGLMLITIYSFGQNDDCKEEKAEKIGLISELVFIKLNSENCAMKIINDTIMELNDRKKIVNLYNKSKTIIDQVILQLIADCRKKNSIKYFRRLDNLLKRKAIKDIIETDLSNKRLKGYIISLNKINILHDKLLDFFDKSDTTDSIHLSSIPVEGLIGILSFITSTVKDIKENNGKKVEKVTQILDYLRLAPLQDLVKKEEVKKET